VPRGGCADARHVRWRSTRGSARRATGVVVRTGIESHDEAQHEWNSFQVPTARRGTTSGTRKPVGERAMKVGRKGALCATMVRVGG
jgi:hypothetical protein